MLKFLFSRAGEPTAPSWNRHPEKAAGLWSRFTFERVCTCSQSDHYKARGCGGRCGVIWWVRTRSVGLLHGDRL
jgi:hypothetical protein